MSELDQLTVDKVKSILDFFKSSPSSSDFSDVWYNAPTMLQCTSTSSREIDILEHCGFQEMIDYTSNGSSNDITILYHMFDGDNYRDEDDYEDYDDEDYEEFW